MNIIEIAGASLGFLFVLLEIRQHKMMWIVGGASALLYMALFYNSSLFASMALQLWYLGASFYGWFKWKKSFSSNEDERVTVEISRRRLLLSSIIAIIGIGVVWLFLKQFSEDPQPLVDALIASLSLLATYWVAHKFIYNWYLWIVVDLIAAVFYYSQGLLLTSLLYLLYSALAIVGLLHWRSFKVRFE